MWCGKAPCYRPHRLPPGRAAPPGPGRQETPSPRVVHRCGKVLWNRMAYVYPEHDAREVWASVLTRARTDLPETTIVMWFSDVRASHLEDDVLTLAVPSALVRERLQHNHLSLIRGGDRRRVRPPREDRVRGRGEPARSTRRRGDRSPRPERPGRSALVVRGDRRGSLAGDLRGSGRGSGSPVPELHVRCVRPGPVEPFRACGGDGGRRGTAVHRVQPAVHLRGGRPRQDPPPHRGRSPYAPAQPWFAREVRHLRAVRDGVHQVRPRTPG